MFLGGHYKVMDTQLGCVVSVCRVFFYVHCISLSGCYECLQHTLSNSGVGVMLGDKARSGLASKIKKIIFTIFNIVQD